MAGYRRVNYYELCRLCTSSEGTKMHIFREEGRRRSLPSKIQTCLPLQVQEEDSLPKIICSSCVEKLESYFEFREACINAEAMLESYFTSLKYSDDLTREGKVSVYVKEEIPKKKDECTATPKVKIPVNNITINPSINDGNLLSSAIQIVTDPEGNRLAQYKVQMQGGIPSLVPFGDQPVLPLSVSIPTLTPQPLKQQSTSTNNTSRSEENIQTANNSSNTIPPPIVTAVAIGPTNQEVLQQIGITAKDRNAITEVLKLKNINLMDQVNCEPIPVNSPQIQGSPVPGQIPNLIPAQIRLDQNQLQQLLNSNIQISVLQRHQRENIVQNKAVNVTRNIVGVPQNNLKTDSGVGKTVEEKDEGETEPKVAMTTVNSNGERLNNSVTGKSNSSETESVKQEGSLKFEGNEAEIENNLEDEIEEANEESQQSLSNEENQAFECDACTKIFKRKEHLFQHKRSHSGERPFVCATCTKAFSRKEHLLRHNVSHTGQKLYACDVCQKSFSRKDNLHKHKKTHGVNGPYICETCGKSFVVKHYYDMHRAQHENFPNTETSTGVSVKHLISTNSTANPLPFKCDLCTKSFSLKSYLTSHRMRHRSKIKKDTEDVQEQLQSQQPQQQQPPPQPQQQQQAQQIQPQPQPQQQEQEQQSSSDLTIPQPTILTSFPASATNLNLTTLNTQLTTINPNALLAQNIIHHPNANVVHIGNNSYLCTPNVTSELLEQYRRIHSS